MGCGNSSDVVQTDSTSTEFAVGLGTDDKEYPGYRLMTALEWGDQAWRGRLFTELSQYGGWKFLEDPAVVCFLDQPLTRL